MMIIFFPLPEPFGRYTHIRFNRLVISNGGHMVYSVTLGGVNEAYTKTVGEGELAEEVEVAAGTEFVELPQLPTDNPNLDISVQLSPTFGPTTIGLLGRRAYAAFSGTYNLDLLIPEDWALETD